MKNSITFLLIAFVSFSFSQNFNETWLKEQAQKRVGEIAEYKGGTYSNFNFSYLSKYQRVVTFTINEKYGEKTYYYIRQVIELKGSNYTAFLNMQSIIYKKYGTHHTDYGYEVYNRKGYLIKKVKYFTKVDENGNDIYGDDYSYIYDKGKIESVKEFSGENFARSQWGGFNFYQNDFFSKETNFTGYYRNGNISFIYNHKNRVFKDFKENGSLNYQVPLINGEKHGSFENKNEKGVLISKGTYKNGNLVGKYIENYENGTPYIITNYILGEYGGSVKDGEYKEYNEKGMLVADYHYKDGEEHGKCIEYLGENGEVIEITNYNKGEKFGEYELKTKSGKTLSKGSYIDGQKKGKWIEIREVDEDAILGDLGVDLLKEYILSSEDTFNTLLNISENESKTYYIISELTYDPKIDITGKVTLRYLNGKALGYYYMDDGYVNKEVKLLYKSGKTFMHVFFDNYGDISEIKVYDEAGNDITSKFDEE